MNELKRLLILFQETWVECEAFRIKNTVEMAGQTANWEKALRGARTLSQGIFQPALSDLDSETPPNLVLEKLLERLAAPRK